MKKQTSFQKFYSFEASIYDFNKLQTQSNNFNFQTDCYEKIKRKKI